ncbi:alpha/beta fold hydrolase [Buchnera aphidicola]|uniref:alpha/beta fold hydrolase n=1 Tax=Buchnera aphidicola TaxID=9 RepID=UPI0034647F83
MYIKIIGKGNINLILLHGWGINNSIWFWIEKILMKDFKLHIIDLPGYGNNFHVIVENLYELLALIHNNTPKKCIWMGWSMGGIISSYMSILYPKKTIAIINICSSPCFIKKKKWPGIDINTIKNIFKNLLYNYKNTIKNFFITNTYNIIKKNTHVQNIIKKYVLPPYPTYNTLKMNLDIICKTDIRKYIMQTKLPNLQIYGKLDTMIPIEISKIINKYNNKNIKIIVIDHSAHMPFISKPIEFCNSIISFKKKL